MCIHVHTHVDTRAWKGAHVYTYADTQDWRQGSTLITLPPYSLSQGHSVTENLRPVSWLSVLAPLPGAWPPEFAPRTHVVKGGTWLWRAWASSPLNVLNFFWTQNLNKASLTSQLALGSLSLPLEAGVTGGPRSPPPFTWVPGFCILTAEPFPQPFILFSEPGAYWLAGQQAHDASCLCLQWWDVRCTLLGWAVYVGAGDRTQVPMIERQGGFWLTHLPVLTSMFIACHERF